MAWGSKDDEMQPNIASSGRTSGQLSFIGGEVTLTGNLSGQGDLHLDGAIEGDVDCKTLIVGPSGRVKGNVTAEKATLGGTVGGTVNARTLIVEKSAKINGDLSYETITIENGAQVDGRLSRRSETAARTPSIAAARTPPVADQPLKLVAGDE